jgi:hypothetical protein
MVHRRELDGREIVLGNQGALWKGAMTWWDHETGSIWSQPLGKAIAGPLEGATLELMPSTLTTWEAWRGAHPATQALDTPGWATGFDLADMAIVIDLGTESAAYPIATLRKVGIVNDVVGGVELAVVIDPDDPARWAVFSRQLDSGVVDLELTGAALLDTVSGTRFDPFTGRALSRNAGSLDRLPAFTIFLDDYARFFPRG